LDWGLKAVKSAFAYIEVETPAMEILLFWHGCYLVIKKGRRLKTSTHYSYLKINECSFTDLCYVNMVFMCEVFVFDAWMPHCIVSVT